MPPAFGFSVGDFISAIESSSELIAKICKALKTAGGAAAEYQQAIIELRSLEQVLRQLDRLEPTEGNIEHVNAIRCMALACRLPLLDFLAKLEKYDGSLTLSAPRLSSTSLRHKAKWAVSLAENVEKLRALVAGKVVSINLLLSTHSMQILSKMESRSRQEHKDLMAKVVEYRDNSHRERRQIQMIASEVADVRSGLTSRFDRMSATVSATQSSVLGLQSIGNRVATFIATFPSEIRDLLRSIVGTNITMYRVLLQLQQGIAKSPTSLLQSNIKFEDALGRKRELPYEYFRHWQPFESFLLVDFRDLPGETKVIGGKYHILDSRRQGALVSRDTWSQSIFPGAQLSMSMILSILGRKEGYCPRPGCSGQQVTSEQASGPIACSKCEMIFYSADGDFETAFNRLDMLGEEKVEQIVSRQAEDDLRVFGARPEPLDPDEFDSMDRKRKKEPFGPFASESEDLRDAKFQRKSAPESLRLTQNVSAVDWNSAATPLEAWLNQCAVPAAGLSPYRSVDEETISAPDDASQEEKEIAFFRKVHIGVSSQQQVVESRYIDSDQLEALGSDAKIYFRNIMDRFPLVPQYLATRLAKANVDRAERIRLMQLSTSEEQCDRSLDLKPFQVQASHEPKDPLSVDATHFPFLDAANHIFRGLYSDQGEGDVLMGGSRGNRFTTIKRQSTEDKEPLPSKKESSSFWTERKSTHRSPSVDSRISSRNSSLRGDLQLDTLEQNPTFSSSQNGSNPFDHVKNPPGLPPPPVQLGTVKTFDCDICGHAVKRGLHPSPEAGSDAACKFCGEKINVHQVHLKDQAAHIAQHMEEIAFAVLAKQYNDWDFYSAYSDLDNPRRASTRPEE
ncbi:MAG: hypothetical protein M1819_001640 [Sarea resinae]|nr:MAG: hypothetical protein M1819_001640 [Sarea resinae]